MHDDYAYVFADEVFTVVCSMCKTNTWAPRVWRSNIMCVYV